MWVLNDAESFTTSENFTATFLSSFSEFWLFRFVDDCMTYAMVLLPCYLFVACFKDEKFEADGNAEGRFSNFFLSILFYGRKFSNKYKMIQASDDHSNVSSLFSTFLRLCFCFVGLQVTYITWGVLQEKVMTQNYIRRNSAVSNIRLVDRFQDSEFLVFFNRLVAFLMSTAVFLLTKPDAVIAPLYEFSYASLANILSSWCQYEALKFISFPAQVLFKCSKVVPVMLMGKVVQRKIYTRHDYACALMIAIGVSLFMLFGGKHSSTRSTDSVTISGIALMIGYLVFDSFTSNWQNVLFDKYKISSLQMMSGVNMFSCILTLISLIRQGRLFSSFRFITQHYNFDEDLLLSSFCGAVGQFFIFYTIRHFGAVGFTLMMTIRQALSILISCIVYKHDISELGIFGIVLVFITIPVKILSNTHLRKRTNFDMKKSSTCNLCSMTDFYCIISCSSSTGMIYCYECSLYDWACLRFCRTVPHISTIYCEACTGWDFLCYSVCIPSPTIIKRKVQICSIAYGEMGAYRYMQEIWRKKQSDVMRFLLRVRTWHYRQLSAIHRASRPTRPEKARRLGYIAKQGFVIYRVRVRRGGRKRKVTKGQTYGKPKNHGVNQLKMKRSLQSIAEQRVGRRCGALRVLNSYWVGQDSTYKFYEVILVDPMHKAIRRDPDLQWICKPTMKHREMRGLTKAGKRSRGLGKGVGYSQTIGGSRRKAWKRRNTLSLRRKR
ncbi:60S ribosomal protein L15 [Trichinella pseudospiralis]|uniref:Ribosomal protein L15 n=1 Tax=Trichinella pseudospiralis TaxID=6337 RepID=A0A0V1IK95_TRIPS|nr:60S ribosomal protein L15 [Trichinella pseudospiralis]